MENHMVFNYTDNIYASNEVFTSKKAAREFIKKFRERFKKKGYYMDNWWNKIPPKEIQLQIIPTPDVFSPFSGWKNK